MIHRYLTLALLTLALAHPSIAQQPGDPDSTFASDGIVTTDVSPTGDDYGTALAIQSDGKLVVVGSTNPGTAAVIAAVRYLPDGSLDATFGTGGKVSTPIGTMDDHANAVVIQPDGKIVVAGTWFTNVTGYGLVVLRYNADGSLDASFSGDGIATDNISTGSTEFFTMALQPDGKILVGGDVPNGGTTDFALVRYNSDGTLDNTFSGDGIQTTDIAANNDAVVAMALQPDGYIVVAGYSDNGTDEDFALARYTPDGTLDGTFGTGGIVTTPFTSGDDRAYALVLQPDGKVVAGGLAWSPPYWIMAMARYNTNGTLDNSFTGDGTTTVPYGIYSGARSVALAADGKIVAGGSTDMNVMVAVFNTDGTLDNTFSSDGITSSNIGDTEYGNAVAVQADGKIVLAAAAHSTATLNDFAVVRYLPSLDVGLLEFTQADPAPLIYPNPIAQEATLAYSLRNNERITIQLLDVEGRAVATFLDGMEQGPGSHALTLALPEGLEPGSYLLTISTTSGRVGVQVVKE